MAYIGGSYYTIPKAIFYLLKADGRLLIPDLRGGGNALDGANIVAALTCNPNNLQFYGLYLRIKGYLLLNCRLLEPQVITANIILRFSCGTL